MTNTLKHIRHTLNQELTYMKDLDSKYTRNSLSKDYMHGLGIVIANIDEKYFTNAVELKLWLKIVINERSILEYDGFTMAYELALDVTTNEEDK